MAFTPYLHCEQKPFSWRGKYRNAKRAIMHCPNLHWLVFDHLSLIPPATLRRADSGLGKNH